MSKLFRREPEDSEPRPDAAASPGGRAADRGRRPSTLIASGTQLSGEVHGTSDLVVEGQLEGEVRVESDVTVGREGRVKGNISARSVSIAGRVEGNVQGSQKVEILPTGRLEGDVVAARVVLSEGAFFKGKVEMTGAAAAGRAPVSTASAADLQAARGSQ